MAQQKQNTRQLTPKQELFCIKYVEIGYASEAYRIAYNCENMKPETVWNNASKLLDNTKVAARVAELQAEYAEASKIDQVKVMETLYDIVQRDVGDLFEEDPKTGKLKVKSPRRLSKRSRHAVKAIHNGRGGVSYEFESKTEAAGKLAKMAGWEAPKKIEMGGNMAIEGKHVMDFSGLPEDDEPEQ